MSREFEVFQRQALKTISIYVMVVILGGLSIATIVEGLRTQLGGNTPYATILYFASLASLASCVYVYTKGRQILSSYG
ncbi:MAG: hypothetical protein HY544_05770 [Candidatus Diapherotrites archaeon]|uniref:Uncharacterized protein n=1 Tax=Candidatus Iainarchaeum sp. TaxID=3101447 RepID=A0A8T3YS77_9ARCH|nr:hypothetical protein [Candidatus Diapherotrites archaeon]